VTVEKPPDRARRKRNTMLGSKYLSPFDQRDTHLLLDRSQITSR
jgi:hypothetical protein